MWDVILFDLDGTLTDPKEGITKSVAYALSYFGFDIKDPDSLTYFIGPPLCDNFRESFGLSEAASLEALKLYRERYSSVGWTENVPYPQISDCLSQLKRNGKMLMVATSKAEPYAVRILEYFGLSKFFDVICGTPLDDPNQTKADVIRTALSRMNNNDLSHAVMVGDRKHDILGGREVGIQTVGVLYGYGTEEELRTYNADFVVSTVSELTNVLLR